MKFWRQAQSTDTQDQLENRIGQKRQAGLGGEPRRRTQHPRQAGRQDQRQEKDKPRGGRHSIPDERQATRQNKDKSWETRPETRAGRRTEHPRPDGRQAGRQDRRQPSEADTASQPRWQTRRRQEKDKTSEADTASQTRGETRWEARPEISPARRTQHPSQGGHTKKALRTPTVNCLGKNI